MVTQEKEQEAGTPQSSHLFRLLTTAKSAMAGQHRSVDISSSPSSYYGSDTRSDVRYDNESDDRNQADSDPQPLDFSVRKQDRSSNDPTTHRTPEMVTEAAPSYFTPSPSPPEQSRANSECVISPYLSTSTASVRPSFPTHPHVAPTDSMKPQNHNVPTATTSPNSPLYVDPSRNSFGPPPIFNPHSLLPVSGNMFPGMAAGQQGLGMVPSLGAGLLTTVPSPMTELSPPSSDTPKPTKFVRPFRAYPKDPVKMSVNYFNSYPTFPYSTTVSPEVVATEGVLAKYSEQKYQLFREVFMAERKAAEHKRNGHSSRNSVTKGVNIPTSNREQSTSAGDSPNGKVGSSEDEVRKMTSGDRPQNTNEGVAPESTSETNTNGDVKIAEQSMMSRKRPASSQNGRNSDPHKDEAYWERRRKNNEAAKRSRDARRQKEDEITIRATYLEHENRLLRLELAAVKNENERLKCQFYAATAGAAPLPTQFLGLTDATPS